MRLLLAAVAPLALLLGPRLAAARPPTDELHLADQLEEDLTPIPAGSGAVFVPTLTSPSEEPPVHVWHRGERVATGTTGARIVLPAGQYRIVLGIGEEGAQPAVEVRVVAGKTEVVRPFFGGVRVALVDLDGLGKSGSWLVTTPDRKTVYGPVRAESGKGARAVPTLLLPPGKYLVVVGTNPKHGEGTLPLVVVAGEVARYKVVLDGDKVVRGEFGDAKEPAALDVGKSTRLRWTIGATGSVTRAERTFSGVQGQWMFANLYSRFEGGIDTPWHLFTLRVNADQTFIGIRDERLSGKAVRPFQNELEGELLYNLRIGGAIGPYARGLARTSALATKYFANEATTAVTRDGAGATRTEVRSLAGMTNDGLPLFDAMKPLTLQGGVGLGLTVLDRDWVTLVARGGPAWRKATYGGGRALLGRAEGGELLLLDMIDNTRTGFELTAIAGLRLGHLVSVESRFDAFLDKDELSSGRDARYTAPGDPSRGNRLIYRWDTSVALQLGAWASLVYQHSARRDELIPFADGKKNQTVETLALRVSYALF